MSFLSMCSIENNILSTPVVKYQTAKGQKRFWQAHAFITSEKEASKVDNASEKLPVPVMVNPIGLNFIKTQDIAAYYTTYGVVGKKVSVSALTVVSSGKNIGKKNETTPFSQAVSRIASEYNSKLPVVTDRIEIMLLHDINCGNWKRVLYPCFLQNKLDGIHLAMFYKKETDDVDIYTRSLKKEITQNHIKMAVKETLKQYPTLFLFGEMWDPELDRQSITSIVNQENDRNITKRLSIYLFDLYDTANPLMKFSDRFVLLQKIMEIINSTREKNFLLDTHSNSTYIKIVNTIKAENREQLEHFYKESINQKFEGIIIRNAAGIYEPGARSFNVLKYKPRFDAEFIVSGFTNGKGKNADLIIFSCKCQSYSEIKSLNLNDYNDCEFSVVPAWTQEERRTALKNGHSYIGKVATVSYDSMSQDGIPLQGTLKDFSPSNI